MYLFFKKSIISIRKNKKFKSRECIEINLEYMYKKTLENLAI